jgi:hypothetical protein
VNRCPLANSCKGNHRATLERFIVNRNVSLALFRAWGNGTISAGRDVDWSAYRSEVVNNYRVLQCAQGYTGNLCGVCIGPVYGRFGFSCVRCLPRSLNNAVIFFVLLVLAALLSCTIYSHLRGTAQFLASTRRLPPRETRAGPAPQAARDDVSSVSWAAPPRDSALSFSAPSLHTAEPAASKASGSDVPLKQRRSGHAAAELDTPDRDLERDQDADLELKVVTHSPTGTAPPSRTAAIRRGASKAKEFLTVAKVWLPIYNRSMSGADMQGMERHVCY